MATSKEEMVTIFEGIAKVLVAGGDFFQTLEADKSVSEEGLAYIGGFLSSLLVITHKALDAARRVE